MKVLITGGSGYLGQFLVRHLSETHEVSYTYNREPLPDVAFRSGRSVSAFKVALSGILGARRGHLEGVDVVVNCAAISQTGRCEADPERARRINVPTLLLEELKRLYPEKSAQPLLVHLSSDQVYDGSRAYWKESDPCDPVNRYGRTKVEAELRIQSEWSNYLILRSSLIYGPKSLGRSGDPKFLDFLVESLRSGKSTSFFSDEYRNPIYVQDIVQIVQHFMQKSCETRFNRIFNMGGPDRLSRVDMAREVAQQLGIENPAIEEIKSAEITRKVPSPLDISMDSQALIQELPFELTPFSTALSQIFPTKQI